MIRHWWLEHGETVKDCALLVALVALGDFFGGVLKFLALAILGILF